MAILLAVLIAQSAFATHAVPVEAGPETHYHRHDGPLTALRLSAPIPDAVDPGTALLLLELARPAAEAEARRLGARVSLEREPGGVVLSVTGPTASFDALVAILRRATAEPELGAAALRRARPRAESRILAGLERPAPRVRQSLRTAVYGEPEPRVDALGRLTPEDVRLARKGLYDLARLRLVVVADVPIPVLRSAVDRWFESATPLRAAAGGAGSGETGDAAGDVAAAAEAQVHNEWAGIGYPLSGSDEAALEVAALLIRQRLQRSPLLYGTAEAWHGAGGAALVLFGAASPGDPVVATTAEITSLALVGEGGPSVVGRYLRRMIAEAAALTGPAAVADAAASLQRRILLEARTPAGRAAVIGRFIAVHPGAPDAVAAFLERLDEVGIEEVRTLLHDALAAPAVLVDVRP